MKTNTVSLIFVCLSTLFALLPIAQAVSPPPDGGYPGQNTAEGDNALFSLSPTDGAFNTAVGWRSLFANTTGSLNTGVGAGTLFLNTSHNNTAVGAGALALNTTGDGNTANGALALLQNTVGGGNTAVGAATLVFNNTGPGNTAVGAEALQQNTDGGGNTAVGASALKNNTGNLLNSSQNTAVGQGALEMTTGSARNTAVGREALNENTTGNSNTAIGAGALSSTTGSDNIAVGDNAGVVLTTGSDNIDIGNDGGVADESATIRIGTSGTQTATYIAGVSGQNATGGDAVFVTSDGKLGTVTAPSSARFKDEIKPMNKASEVLLALKPVTFRYKKNIDPNGIQQFGLVAEEVEKVDPDLVKRDRDGKLQTVRYDAVNAMLLNEFLKEHETVQELKKQVTELTAGLQKVSAQLELNKPAPQTVLTDQ